MHRLAFSAPSIITKAFQQGTLLATIILSSGCSDFYTRLRGEPEPIPVDSIETHHFPLLSPDQGVVGQVAIVQSEADDSLVDLARYFGLGLNEIELANPNVDLWVPEPETDITLPLQFVLPDAPHEGVVINLPTMRVFRYESSEDENGIASTTVSTYPTGIGRDGWETPSGTTKIIRKTANPAWYVPASIRREHAEMGDPLPSVVKAGPDNPLGAYAMHLGLPSYLIHGTNKPYGVGLRISHGCIRLYPEDIEQLFQQVSVNTAVHIINQPYLAGWQGDTLYVEAHPALESSDDEVNNLRQSFFEYFDQLIDGVTTIPTKAEISTILDKAEGIPVAVASRQNNMVTTLKPIYVRHPVELIQPERPPLLENEGQWLLLVDSFADEKSARKLAAILNHQGPPIFSRLRKGQDEIEVIAGPYADEAKALKASARLLRDFEIQAEIIQPQKNPATI